MAPLTSERTRPGRLIEEFKATYHVTGFHRVAEILPTRRPYSTGRIFSAVFLEDSSRRKYRKEFILVGAVHRVEINVKIIRKGIDWRRTVDECGGKYSLFTLVKLRVKLN